MLWRLALSLQCRGLKLCSTGDLCKRNDGHPCCLLEYYSTTIHQNPETRCFVVLLKDGGWDWDMMARIQCETTVTANVAHIVTQKTQRCHNVLPAAWSEGGKSKKRQNEKLCLQTKWLVRDVVRTPWYDCCGKMIFSLLLVFINNGLLTLRVPYIAPGLTCVFNSQIWTIHGSIKHFIAVSKCPTTVSRSWLHD